MACAPHSTEQATAYIYLFFIFNFILFTHLSSASTTTATGTGLTKAGAGVLVLSSAANNFNGAAVSITGGILKYGIAAAIPTTSAIVVGAGAGLDLNGFDFNPQTQSLTVAGFVTNSAASTSTLLVAGTSATDVTTTGDVTFGLTLADNNALNASASSFTTCACLLYGRHGNALGLCAVLAQHDAPQATP